MADHRIKFGPGARMVIAGRSSHRDAAQQAVNDLTSDGTQLRYIHLPPNAQGRRIRIYGRTFIAEAGTDGRRLDTIFVFRLSTATESPPPTALTVTAGFEFLDRETVAEGVPIGPIFAGIPAVARMSRVPPRSGPSDKLAARETRRRAIISDRLAAILARAGSELRSILHPLALDHGIDLERLKQLWRQLVETSRRRPSAPTREDLILAGITQPTNRGMSEVPDLRRYFESVFISEILEQQVENPERVHALVNEFARSTVPTDTGRAVLWAAACSTLRIFELRDELISFGESCGALGSERERPWWDAICKQIYDREGAQRGSAQDDASLVDLLAMLRVADDSDETNLRELEAWARSHSLARRTSAPEAPTSQRELVNDDEAAPNTLRESSPAPTATLCDEEHRAVIEEWTMRRGGVSRETLEELRADLQVVGDSALGLAVALHDMSGLLRLATFGQLIRDFESRRRLDLNDETALGWKKALEASRRAFEAASRTVNSSVVAAVLNGSAVSPEDLQAAAGMFALRDSWDHLPRWWWQHLDGEDGTGTENLDDTGLLRRFGLASARNLTRSACDRLRDLDAGVLEAIAHLRPPPRGTPAEQHLALEISRLSRDLTHVREKYAASLGPMVDANKLAPDDLMELGSALDQIEPRLSPEAFAALCNECSGLDSGIAVRRNLRATDRALDLWAGFLNSDAIAEERAALTRELTWSQVLKKRQFTADAEPSPTSFVSDVTLHFADVGTTFIDDETKEKVTIADRPPLFFSALPDAAFGEVRLPIVVRAKRPRTFELAFSLRDDKGTLRANWPSSTTSPDPVPATKRFREEDWHFNSESSDYSATVALAMPIRRPERPDARLTFVLVATADGAEITHRFTWERFVLGTDAQGKPLLAIKGWTLKEAPSLARAVPVGPQVHLQTAHDRIRAGDSLAVRAPRRFGKSSLLALLEEELERDKEDPSVTVRIDCNIAASDGSRKINHATLWKLVSDELGRKLPGGGLAGALDGGRPPLPTADDFQAARALAAVKGKRRIVIFFDEAQRMFDSDGSYSDRLRQLIIRGLGEREGLAQVVLCFAGLTTMTDQRLGADLAPLLKPLSHQSLNEEQIARVIRKVVGKEQTLFTTRAARERLARSAWDLFALHALLTRLKDLAKEERRLWVSLEDVIQVEDEILRLLRRGEDPESISTYIRDSLNAGISPGDFRPVRAYPVAMAYALALESKRMGKDALSDTRRTLTEWSRELFRDQLTGPRFEPAVIEEHLTSLVEMRVLERSKDPREGPRFRSEFLRSYLVGQHAYQAAIHDPLFREVFLHAGSRTVRLPPETERVPLGRGAQAQAYLFEHGGDRLTGRLRELRTQAEHEAFLENVVLLEKIRAIHTGNREGAEAIFKLRDVGLVADSGPSGVAVEVYDYIPGVDLSTKLGRLDAPVIVKIGRTLARALALVHEHDVLHRDIRPENVILKDLVFPVLIDFGLACVRSVPGGTPLDDAYTAPEVKQRDSADWTAAADVYALAKTLDRMLSASAPQAERDALRNTLARFTSIERKARESASLLADALDRVATELDVRGREHQAEESLERIVADDPRAAELRYSIHDCSLQVAGFALGMYDNERERLCAAAFVVNKIHEKCMGESVGQSYGRKGINLWDRGVSAIVNLRNEFSHGKSDVPKRTFTRDELLRGVAEVADWIRSPKLPALMTAMLELGRP